MESVEIDNIEVTDSVVSVYYWISGYNDLNSVMFSTGDFESWLQRQRKVSISAYWDHWDSQNVRESNRQIVLDDVKRYLLFRFKMIRHPKHKPGLSYSDKKPMTRVSKSGGSKGSRTA